MQMNLRAPVAQLRTQTKVTGTLAPCMARLACGQRSQFFSGSTDTFVSISSRSSAPQRAQRMKVEAAKKSVGDLSKADLEGKTVLVSPIIIRASSRLPHGHTLHFHGWSSVTDT